MPHTQRIGILQRQRNPRQTRRRRDLDHRQIGLGVRRHHFSLGPETIMKDHQHIFSVLNNVTIGHNMALVVIDKAGPLALLQRAFVIRQAKAHGATARHLNIHHRRCHHSIQIGQRLLILCQGRRHLRCRGQRTSRRQGRPFRLCNDAYLIPQERPIERTQRQRQRHAQRQPHPFPYHSSPYHPSPARGDLPFIRQPIIWVVHTQFSLRLSSCSLCPTMTPPP